MSHSPTSANPRMFAHLASLRWKRHKESELRALLAELLAKGVGSEQRRILLQERAVALEYYTAEWLEYFASTLNPSSELYGDKTTLAACIEPPHLKAKLAREQRQREQDAARVRQEQQRRHEVAVQRAQAKDVLERAARVEAAEAALAEATARIAELEHQVAHGTDPVQVVRNPYHEFDTYREQDFAGEQEVRRHEEERIRKELDALAEQLGDAPDRDVRLQRRREERERDLEIQLEQYKQNRLEQQRGGP